MMRLRPGNARRQKTSRAACGRGCAPGEGTGIAGEFEMMLNGVAMGSRETTILRGSCVPHKRSTGIFSLCLRKSTAAAAKIE